MKRKKLSDYRTAVFDCETDPFSKQRAETATFPKPFTCAFHDGERFIEAWGPDCVERVMGEIAGLDDHYLIYVHNGGRFDFHFLFDYVEEPVFIIGSRLIEFSQGVHRRKAHHIWRDSLAIIPVALAEFHKTKIDYGLMEASRRDLPRNRRLIAEYLRDDCRDLFALVSAFRARFEDDKGGVPITVGQTAMREFLKFHTFERATERTDEHMRGWYFGGRTQCFAAGLLTGPFVYFDVNSSYPYAMRNFSHPVTDDWEQVDRPPLRRKGVWFAKVTARNRQALPVRLDGKTEFDCAEGMFWACSHELVPAIEFGQVEILAWHEIWVPAECKSFAAYVVYWYTEKTRCKLAGDRAGELFAKFMLNSCYGKMGQDPRQYKEYALCRDPFGDLALNDSGYEPDTMLRQEPWLELYSKPAPVFGHSFYNVGIAASITSAARSTMLRGLRDAVDPIYCDTDSVVCRAFTGNISDTALGAWKHETWVPPGTDKKIPVVAEYAAIAGRKTYCLYNKAGRKVIPIKWASKGGELTPEEIIDVARGGELEKVNEAPTFSFKSDPRYIKRTFRMTVDPEISAFARELG